MPNSMQDFFRQATLKICGSLEIEKALFSTLEYVKKHLPADGVHLYIYEPDTGGLRCVASATEAGGDNPETLAPLTAAARKRLESGSFPHLSSIASMARHQIARPVAQSLGLPPSSALVMILRLEGMELGAVVVNADGNRRYREVHARHLAQLNEPFAIALSNCLRYREVARMKELLADDNQFLQNQLRSRAGEEIVGADFGLKGVMEMVREVAPLPSPVLLLGETGTGKEIIAGAVHNLSPRRKGPFIRVNCGALPPSLLDSELFGHEKGAFTGAVSRRRGLFERADGGTIFLDEVGELPLEAQVRLLRVIQEKEIDRVGGSEPVRLDIRLVAATHRDLFAMTARAAFREDLYFRLKVFPISIPPLRDRKTDIPVLAQHFLQKKALELGVARIPDLAAGAMERLLAYPWPGNVRELENTIERALIVCKTGPLDFAELESGPLSGTPPPAAAPPGEDLSLEGVTARHIRRVLALCQGRVEGEKGAARLLAVNPSTLRNKMRKLGIAFGRGARPGR